jgi:uncharacterized damage-inducible protein DinB
MTDDPRYPIGRYAPPETIDAATRAAWIEAVMEAPAQLRRAVAGLDDAQLDTPYRQGGWSVRQVVHHLPDSHLHTYLRFKWALAEDTPVVAGYDPAAWAGLPDSVHGAPEPALALFESLHARWSLVLDGMDDADFDRRYINPGNGLPRTLGWTLGLYAWHGEHHVAQIVALRERRAW